MSKAKTALGEVIRAKLKEKGLSFGLSCRGHRPFPGLDLRGLPRQMR